MFIDNKNGRFTIELNEFDVEKTQIDIGDMTIDMLILPSKYKRSKNLLIYRLLDVSKKVIYKK